MSYEVEVAFEVEGPGLDEAAVLALATRALDLEQVADEASLSIVISDDATVHELNREYRGVDSPTDVLSFGLSDLAQPAGDVGALPAFVLPPETATQLGEVIVSHDTAIRQAAEHGRALAHELAHLVIHGILHLLGHDHALPDEEQVMRAREDTILQACGFPPGTAGWSYTRHD
jgi:probable rRNA maturation factor